MSHPGDPDERIEAIGQKCLNCEGEYFRIYVLRSPGMRVVLKCFSCDNMIEFKPMELLSAAARDTVKRVRSYIPKPNGG